MRPSIIEPAVISAAILFAGQLPDASAQTIHIAHAGDADLALYDCRPGRPSSFVELVCYRGADHKMIVRLKDRFYAYCAVPPDVVRGLREAEVPGRYYVAHIRAPSPFDCRLAPMAVATEPAAPARPSAPPVRSMFCRDGTLSHAAHRSGACSHHGGLRD